ncbi:MAG: type II 3-dehydroquinate dehydratase [Oscillospiraceae bacterium]
MKFLVINGPNMNLLGQREPELYGTRTYADLCVMTQNFAARHDSITELYQSNHEGALIDRLQAAEGKYDGIVLNPAAYTHTSYAIYDALCALTVPVVEVHLTDITAREEFRRVSVTAPACIDQIMGHGMEGYVEALELLLDLALEKEQEAKATERANRLRGDLR